MKKFITLFMVMLMAMSMVACTSGTDGAATPNEDAVQQEVQDVTAEIETDAVSEEDTVQQETDDVTAEGSEQTDEVEQSDTSEDAVDSTVTEDVTTESNEADMDEENVASENEDISSEETVENNPIDNFTGGYGGPGEGYVEDSYYPEEATGNEEE